MAKLPELPPEYIEIAAKMLSYTVRDFEHMYPEVKRRLDEIDRMCHMAGGRLRSRQVIASVIENWERNRP